MEDLAVFWTVFVLFVLQVLSFLDRAVFTQLLIEIQQDLSLSDTQVGLLGGTAFSLFYCVAATPLSVLVGYVGSRHLLLFGSCIL